ncbi:MAG: hypothetical protein IT569_02285 [Leptospiraceae bacterium]|nr:hypothetical protein [Leptospiraceae bacterium]
MPSGFESQIASIDFSGKEIEEAYPPMSVTIRLQDEIDIGRGDTIVKKENLPLVSQDIEAEICWMDSKPLVVGSKYLILHNTNLVKCVVKEIRRKLDFQTLEETNASSFSLNDIGRVVLRTAKPLVFDPYAMNRFNGAAVLIDEGTNGTVGAIMISGENI